MKLIIDIHEKDYQSIKNGQISFSVIDAIIKGTPLDDVRTEMEAKCDRINSLASVLPYTAHREIQGLLCDIMDLRKESEGKE